LYILAIWPAHTNNLSGRIPDKLLQRSGQVRLIEVTKLMDRVEDRNPLLEESLRSLGAFELTDMALRQPGRLQEPVPDASTLS